MRFAFGIGSLFLGGGLQRDCIEVAKHIRATGNDVVIYTSRLLGTTGCDLPIVLVPNSAWTNHGRQQRFAAEFFRRTVDEFNLVVGFDKLVGLDLLYCADRSIRHRISCQPYLALLSRYRTYNRIESDSFLPGGKTRILLLNQKQRLEYVNAWGTEPNRILELPPSVSLTRRQPELRFGDTRAQVRAELNLGSDDWVWLAVGTQPHTKGLDRTLRALRDFPQARLVIAGLTDRDHRAIASARTARLSGVSSQVTWLGHREDIERIMAACDVLVHPARYDTTGTVIVEALVNGLPAVTTDVCGYAKHVQVADAGIVLEEPFDFQTFAAALRDISNPVRWKVHSEAALNYIRNTPLFDGRYRVAQLMVEMAKDKQRASSVSTARERLKSDPVRASRFVPAPLARWMYGGEPVGTMFDRINRDAVLETTSESR